MATDLFAQTDDIDNTPLVDPNKDYLSELVGEGKKFKDLAALARAKAESDAFVSHLTSELKELKQELNTRSRLEEVVTRLTESRSVTPSNVQDPPAREENREPQGLTAEALEELLNRKLTERDTRTAKERNVESAKAELLKSFGPDYINILKTKAAELGTSTDWFNNLAAENPKALMALVGAPPQRQESGDIMSPPRSQVSTTFIPQSTDRDKAYYDKIKRDNPSQYWHKDTQVQMHKDAMRLGERFFT